MSLPILDFVSPHWQRWRYCTIQGQRIKKLVRNCCEEVLPIELNVELAHKDLKRKWVATSLTTDGCGPLICILQILGIDTPADKFTSTAPGDLHSHSWSNAFGPPRATPKFCYLLVADFSIFEICWWFPWSNTCWTWGGVLGVFGALSLQGCRWDHVLKKKKHWLSISDIEVSWPQLLRYISRRIWIKKYSYPSTRKKFGNFLA